MKKTTILLIGAGGQLGSELTQGLWRIYGKDTVIASDIKDPVGILKEGRYEKFDVMQRDKLFELPDLESVAVCHGCCPDALEELISLLSPRYSRDQLSVWTIGPVIGTHGGSGVIGLIWHDPA